jgi:hypothetical protein
MHFGDILLAVLDFLRRCSGCILLWVLMCAATAAVESKAMFDCRRIGDPFRKTGGSTLAVFAVFEHRLHANVGKENGKTVSIIRILVENIFPFMNP